VRAKVVTAALATRSAVHPRVLARRVMRLLRLGSAWGQCAMWIERRRPPVQIGSWSAPLVVRPGSVHATNPLAAPVGSGRGVRAAEAGAPMPVTRSTDVVPLLRCLLVTPRLDAGGVQEVVAFLARRLPSRGWQTAVLCTSPDAMVDGQLTGVTAKVLRSDGIDVIGADARRAAEFARRWRPDVISGHGAPAWAFALAEKLGVPYVDNLHSLNGLVGRDWRWHTDGVRSGHLACVVAVSEILRQQQLARNPGFPADRIVTIPNGVDAERMTVHDRVAVREWLGIADQYVFVSLGRHCMQKNMYGLVTAFGDVARRRRDVHLVIAGKISEPRYFRRVAQLANTLPARTRIHLRDNMANPAPLLAAADGFVLDSFFEGWPLASMEALVNGLPVIITDVGGAHEQICGEPARGYVVPNPLGDPLLATWASSAAAQYRAQANRDELVATMALLVANRDDYLRNRDCLAAESAVRFSAGTWLERHAGVLRAAARGGDPAGTHAASTAARI
jgi:glycosyltransferase involved in cell wall biosynthesis